MIHGSDEAEPHAAHGHHHHPADSNPHGHHEPAPSAGTDLPPAPSAPDLEHIIGRRIAYIDCFAGASGDMLVGALIDAGLSLTDLRSELTKLELAGYELEAEMVRDHGLTGTGFRVRDTLQAYPARHVDDIRRIVQGSALSENVKRQSMAAVERLGRAEAKIHGIPLEEVHFHEIGAVDTIVDIVGFVLGLELLRVDQVFASAVPLGSGTIDTEHGRLPVPAPATLALLAAVGAPTVPHPARTEIVTPTGAALLAQTAIFELPAMRVQAVGYGFGMKKLPWANAVRVWIGERESTLPYERDQVIEMECNLDDTTGEALGYTMEQLFAAGALDVWFSPIQMKKNRPAVMLSALSPREKVDELVWIIMRETSTLGVRLFPPAHRLKADRRMVTVETPWGPVRVKEKWVGERRLAASPEYEDCARLARESGEPITRVMAVARQVAEQ